MMHTIRTTLPVGDTAVFRKFLETNGMGDIIVGNYDNKVNIWQIDKRICYAYSDTFTESIANMAYILLKHASIELAFNDYKASMQATHALH